MAGLLDYFSDPRQQALLGMASGLLTVGGPSPYPRSLGQGLGQGLLTGANLFNQATQVQGQAQMRNLQTQMLEQQLAQKKMQQEIAQRLMGGGAAGAPAMPSGGGAGMSPATSPFAFGSPQFASEPAQMPVPTAQAPGNALGISLRDVAAMRMAGLPDLTPMFTAGQPKIGVTPSGVAYDERGTAPGTTFPVMSEAFGAYQTRQAPGGGWQIDPVPGGAAMRRSALQAGAEVTAANEPAKVMIGGREVDTTRAVANAINTGVAPDPSTSILALQTIARHGGAPRSIRVGGAGDDATAAPATGGLRVGERPTPAETAAATAFAEGKAKEAVGESAKFREKFDSAQTQIGNLDLLQEFFANPSVASGALAEPTSALKGILDSFGVKVEGKSQEDVAQSLSREMALRFRTQGGQNLMPGAMTDYEQRLLQSINPSLSQSREGRLLLVQVMRAKSEKDLRLAEMAADYEDRNGRLDAGFYREARAWAKANPMFTEQRIAAMTELAKRLASGRR